MHVHFKGERKKTTYGDTAVPSDNGDDDGRRGPRVADELCDEGGGAHDVQGRDTEESASRQGWDQG